MFCDLVNDEIKLDNESTICGLIPLGVLRPFGRGLSSPACHQSHLSGCISTALQPRYMFTHCSYICWNWQPIRPFFPYSALCALLGCAMSQSVLQLSGFLLRPPNDVFIQFGSPSAAMFYLLMNTWSTCELSEASYSRWGCPWSLMFILFAAHCVGYTHSRSGCLLIPLLYVLYVVYPLRRISVSSIFARYTFISHLL